jgi:transposase
MKRVAYVGVDYHVNSVSVGVLIEGASDFLDCIHIRNDDKMIRKYLIKLSKDYELRVCYEACSSGYVFQRKVNGWGWHCDVIAPSLIPRKLGDRRKNDFRDARNLARNYRAGMLTVVHSPSEEEESIRAIIRCRFALKEAAKRTKHQINTFVLGQGHHWPKSKWGRQHRLWLTQIRILLDPHLQIVLDEHLGHLDYLESRIERLEQEIGQIARSDIYAPSVNKLCAFKGIAPLSAMLLIAEITDFRRFGSPGALMAFLGLVPSEDSSGDKQRGGSVTKAGNPRCRVQIIESVQHYVKRALISPKMKENLAKIDAQSANIAIKCVNRLHKRFWALTMKGKNRNVAITAIAREFVGFIWAMMQCEPQVRPA